MQLRDTSAIPTEVQVSKASGTALTDEQIAYLLAEGFRFEIKLDGKGDPVVAAIVRLKSGIGFVLFELEKDGVPAEPRKYFEIPIQMFRSWIIREMATLTPEKREERGYNRA